MNIIAHRSCLVAVQLLVSVYCVSASAAPPYNAVAASRHHVCALNASSQVECNSSFFKQNLQVLPTETFNSISSGQDHVCGITTDSGVICWGDPEFERLVIPPFTLPVVQLDAGALHTCALDSGGFITCWGMNNKGQSDAPPVNGDFTSVTAGRMQSCGVRQSGELVCWGNVEPEGEFDTILPLPDSIPLMQKVDLSHVHACGLTLEQTLYCWGHPLPSIPTGQYIDVLVSEIMTCGVLENGQLDCSFAAIRPDLELPPENRNFQQVSSTISDDVFIFSSDFGLCGLDENGDIDCWGRTGPPPPRDLTGLLSPEWIPTNLKAFVYADDYIELQWILPQAEFRIWLLKQFEIEVNGVIIDATTNSNSYNLRNPEKSVDLNIRIRTQHMDGRYSEFSNSVSVNTDSLEPADYQVPERPSEPTGLRIDVYSATTLELFWNRVLSNPPVGYEIRRNGQLIGFTRGTSFVDNDVPDKHLHYDIIAVDLAGTILGFSGISLEPNGHQINHQD